MLRSAIALPLSVPVTFHVNVANHPSRIPSWDGNIPTVDLLYMDLQSLGYGISNVSSQPVGLQHSRAAVSYQAGAQAQEA